MMTCMWCYKSCIMQKVLGNSIKILMSLGEWLSRKGHHGKIHIRKDNGLCFYCTFPTVKISWAESSVWNKLLMIYRVRICSSNWDLSLSLIFFAVDRRAQELFHNICQQGWDWVLLPMECVEEGRRTIILPKWREKIKRFCCPR